MFNVGPMELLVLAIVGLIVLGPDKLPGLARDAAKMLRTLRDLATGAREQLRDELGPEFADVDLRTLNPRTALRDMVFGDEDPSDYHPRNAVRRAVWGDGNGASSLQDDLRAADPRAVMRDDDDAPAPTVRMDKPVPTEKPVQTEKPVTRQAPSPRPRPRPSPYDADAT
jgi:sec-independent protein translocase protein TatB